MGDIGRPLRHVEFEPMPETAPISEPAPAAPVPEREREEQPA